MLTAALPRRLRLQVNDTGRQAAEQGMDMDQDRPIASRPSRAEPIVQAISLEPQRPTLASLVSASGWPSVMLNI